MKTFYAIAWVVLAGTVCFGQTSYKGLTPGKSTKADAAQVLGQPARSLSETLIEYGFPETSGKTYVQYRDKSPTAIAERIELTCEGPLWEGKCSQLMMGLATEHVELGVRENLWPDAVLGGPLSTKSVIYYGEPRFVVTTSIGKDSNLFERRFAFYSAALYEAARPKGGCTGSIFGEWDTNRGHMVIERVGNLGFKGTYSGNNGTFTGRYDEKAIFRRYGARRGAVGFTILAASFGAQQRDQGAFVGEWKDDTGGGTMSIAFELGQTTFRGAWARTSGAGPGGGTWEGRCIQ